MTAPRHLTVVMAGVMALTLIGSGRRIAAAQGTGRVSGTYE